MKRYRIIQNPVTLKRLKRFKASKLSYYAFWLLVGLYGVSLCAELICNNTPLLVRFNGHFYFPIFKYYPENEFMKNGKLTRPDYKAIAQKGNFTSDPANYMIFPVIPYGPDESIDPATLFSGQQKVTVLLKRVRQMGTVNIQQDFSIYRSRGMGPFWRFSDDREGELQAKGQYLDQLFTLPTALRKAVEVRFANRDAPSIVFDLGRDDGTPVQVSLSTYRKRNRQPRTVRLTFAEKTLMDNKTMKIAFNTNLAPEASGYKIWQTLSPANQAEIRSRVQQRFQGAADPFYFMMSSKKYKAVFQQTIFQFPYPPVKNHFMGIDSAGRDVLTRILYGLRISMTFGLLLVGCSMLIGMIIGSVQGYWGSWVDISIQRGTEIWQALPFLYVMILMGSVYGRSFILLLICYGLFNWIGISYYIRAEVLKLRRYPFVESAKCMGLPVYKIIFKHIMPNALVPVITFFPFSLVGAIGSLAALDYLGFGLPPPTPSWGELLYQAQEYRWAWWLILYPSMALFGVMLLGVFIGEGIRNAYDPKPYTRLT